MDDTESQPVTAGGGIAIYSKRAVWGFSIFFTPLVGGMLLMQNLRQAGKKRDSYLALALGAVLTAATAYVVNIPDKPRSGLTNICNLIGGAILSEVLFRRYFREGEYAKKTIRKPLIIAVLASIPFLLASIYAAGK